MTVHYDIRKARKAAGLTQTALAEKLGILRNNVSCWERGVYLPTPEHLAAVCQATGCRIGDIATIQADSPK